MFSPCGDGFADGGDCDYDADGTHEWAKRCWLDFVSENLSGLVAVGVTSLERSWAGS